MPIIIILIACILSCCVGRRGEREHVNDIVTQAGDCDKERDALQDALDEEYGFFSSRQAKAGSSYMLTTGGYVVDVVVLSALALVVVAIPCAIVGGRCYVGPGPYMNISNEASLGHSTYYKTKTWRSIDYEKITGRIRTIAACFEHLGGAENLQRAYTQMTLLKESDWYFRVDEVERDIISREVKRLKALQPNP